MTIGFGVNPWDVGLRPPSMPFPAPPYSAFPQAIEEAAPGAVRSLGGYLPQLGEYAGGLGVRGTLGAGLKAGGYGLAGDVASYGIGKAIPGSSTLEHVLSGTAKGAGIGAGIGAIGLPVPVLGEVTTAGGALIGGAIGGLGGLLFGGKKKQKNANWNGTKTLTSIMQGAQIDPVQSSQLLRYWNTLNSSDGKNQTHEQRVANFNAITTAVKQMVLNGQTGQASSANPMQYTPAQQAAIQQQTAQFLAPYTQDTLNSAQSAADYTMSQLGNIPEAYRGVFAAGAQQELSASRRMANAYAAQAALSPYQDAYQAQQQGIQSVAAQLLQQSTAQTLANQGVGGSGSSGNDFASALAQAQQATG